MPLPECTIPHRAVVVVLVIAGCAGSRQPVAHTEDPPLYLIQRAFADAVADAHNDGIVWHSGWLGNLMVAAAPDQNAGKCIDWQELAYHAVYDEARRWGWEVWFVRVNPRTIFEHNATVVFDGDVMTVDDVRCAEPDAPVYVLDGWARGEADVYQLNDWLDAQGHLVGPMELFEPQRELVLRDSINAPRHARRAVEDR